jgi:tRNA (guanine-N7-)-methyltransferase
MTKPMPFDKPLPPGSMESEFGVLVPGVTVAPERWTVSALKQWPAVGPLDWPEVFGRQAPVVLDLGCGNGRSVLVSAVARPGLDHLGVDSLPVVIRYARKRARQRGLANVRFAVGDAAAVVARHIAPASVAELHVYHPQPYYDPAMVGLRLITPTFLFHAHRILVPGGLLVLQTDNPAYWRYMLQVAPAFFDFHEHAGPWPDAPEGRTRREIIARLKGLAVFRGTGVARADIDPVAARRLAERLPEPVFNADRRLMELDEMESQWSADGQAQTGAKPGAGPGRKRQAKGGGISWSRWTARRQQRRLRRKK